jgi:peptidoglycan hydrolase-like protein with peptidoglycan-binding domain
MPMLTSELQRRLNLLGFAPGPVDGVDGPATRTAVARFQLAYNLGNHLTVDAVAGPFTFAALTEVERRGNRLSPSFTVGELRSKGDATCWVHRDLLVALERLRSSVGRPLPIVSGWRDVAHNRRVGGALSSQHTYGAAPELSSIRRQLAVSALQNAGRAADFNRGYITLDDARALRLFSGIGWREDRGVRWVTHVDVRTNATPDAPTVWQYR